MKCSVCGVDCARSRSGRWVHTELLPDKIEEHDALPVEKTTYLEAQKDQAVIESLSQALLQASRAFVAYGTHLPTCQFSSQAGCTCGYLVALKQLTDA